MIIFTLVVEDKDAVKNNNFSKDRKTMTVSLKLNFPRFKYTEKDKLFPFSFSLSRFASLSAQPNGMKRTLMISMMHLTGSLDCWV